MKKYIVYVDNGLDRNNPKTGDVIKIPIPEDSKRKARNRLNTDKSIVTIADVSDQFHISSEKVRKALEKARFDSIEIGFIIKCLDYCEITTPEVIE